MRAVATASIVLAAGYALGGALFWGLLNVPESNGLALALSALLVLLVAVTAGATTALAAALSLDRGFTPAARRAVTALPAFAVGLAIFASLWWLTGRAEAWWTLHAGEADALIISRTGVTRTALLHRSIASLLWFVRWAVGLSAIAALVVAAIERGPAALVTGLRLAVRGVPLLAATIGALVVSQGLWAAVFWAPRALPANWAETVFVGTKLVVLYALATLVAAAVLRVCGTRLRVSDAGRS
jgi:hypothetical protein